VFFKRTLFPRGRITARSLSGKVPTSDTDIVSYKDTGTRSRVEVKYCLGQQKLQEYQSTQSLECATCGNDSVLDQQMEVERKVSGGKPSDRYQFNPRSKRSSTQIRDPDIVGVLTKLGKAIPVTGCETSRLPHFLDNRLIDGGKVVSLTRRPLFTPP
jgi:hypothetical protein